MMKNNRLKLFLNVFTDQKSTLKFAIGVMIGFGFSIAVILATMGIMDGFEKSLRTGLKKSNGDIVINSRHGFFSFDENLKNSLLKNKITKYSLAVQTESFLIVDEDSKGVLVKGIDDTYGDVVGLKIKLNPNEVAIGAEIAKSFSLKVGDEIALAFAKGNIGMKSLPGLNRFKISAIIEHGIYQKDSRLIYAPINNIQTILELSNRINSISINVDKNNLVDVTSTEEENIFRNKISELTHDLGNDYYLRPYWKEFAPLIEAVKVEKVMISLILQLVVVISIFNVLAFIIFINEKKAKELFLFKALGVSQKALSEMWFQLIVICWGISCAIAVVLVQIFKVLLSSLSLFKLPADIYYMPRLELFVSYKDYFIVFFLAFVWINLITIILLRRIKKKSLLEGLRQEFS